MKRLKLKVVWIWTFNTYDQRRNVYHSF